MATARVIRTGTTQTVELPEGVRLNGDQVEVVQRGDEVVLRDPTSLKPGAQTDWERLFDALAELGELIGEPPDDPPPEDRPGL
jgi:virulence-associated protein VagC